MCDEFIYPGLVEDARLSRRHFGLLATALAGTLATGMAGENVVEQDVVVPTPDGQCDAALFEPKGKGRHTVILMWPDIMGLRPAFRDMGRRLAGQGYIVLVPNPFYRSARAPVIDASFDFNNPDQRSRLFALRKSMTDDGIDRDARAFLAFLDARPQADRKARAGVQGYCMGGALAFRTAAANPGRIGAVASFHGGNGLVTNDPDSPHLLIARTAATYLILQARNDDAQQPGVKDVLRKACADAGRPTVVEVYPADHGWCVPGGQTYDPAQAERAWSALLELYLGALT
ncbi:dienelactone hydrolase family protein [Sphingomonas oryzagri]|uniref:Dienelactone hydrolase family protein n=1 Tax=Sphingomonas oryzagri TaxID=3042314 RepID=A0ABT6N1Z6_9SPHN|nr:dienelactone hydrolase family protein [Sphingomonas oryzagri]MDH7639299.1 dienelactone hydrolase family protein [Sphingomonas oryzagri]